MKKRYFILMFLVLLLAISAVSASENITNIESNDSIGLSEHDSDVITNSSIDDVTDDSDSAENVSYNLSGNDVENFLFKKPSYKFRLTDSGGKPVSNESVLLKLNGVNYYRVTDNQGFGNLDLSNLKLGKYVITAEYQNKSISNNIKLMSIKATSKDIKTAYGTKTKFNIKLTDNFGNSVKNYKITVKIGSKKYHITTKSNGIATLSLNYNSGRYIIHYSGDGFSGKNHYTVKNKIKLSVLKWGNKGDITKTKLMNRSIAKYIWVKKAINATAKGIPILKFKGGPGKVVFITAGVHGNELASQVAAMKMIKYLSKTPLKGTVYVVPFVNVKAISKKVRFTDKDYNRIAAKSGTIPNKIVKLIAKYNCDYYGDFHTTQPQGIPGKDVVMASKAPNLKSYKIAKYIFNQCHVNKIIYDYAGQKYPGAIEGNVNLQGIPSVLCEVMLPHNTLNSKSIKLSFSMMKSLLNYSKVI